MSLSRNQSFRHIRYVSLMLLIGIFLISACDNASSEPTRQVIVNEVQVTVSAPSPQPYIFKTSEPNSITVHGDLVVLDPMTMIPAPNDSIFLVPLPIDQPISTIPQFEEGTVPQADVDESVGEFVFNSLQLGQYAVVVITNGGAQIPVRYMDSASYAIFTLDSTQVDTTVELGSLTLP